MPTASGRMSGTIARIGARSTAWTRSGLRSSESRVRRLQLQPSANARHGAVEAVLPARPACRVRAHVLEEEELPAGPQHARDLLERDLRVGHGAEDERRDDGVERRGGERQRLRAGQDDLGPPAERVEAATELRGHRLVGLGEGQVDVVGVVRGVEAGAGPDLQHPAVGLGHERAAALGKPGPLGGPEERVIDRSGEA